jgi:hypothetical protein
VPPARGSEVGERVSPRSHGRREKLLTAEVAAESQRTQRQSGPWTTVERVPDTLPVRKDPRKSLPDRLGCSEFLRAADAGGDRGSCLETAGLAVLRGDPQKFLLDKRNQSEEKTKESFS